MVDGSDFEAAARSAVRHPGQVPSGKWAVQMRWHDLVFCHWRVDKAVVAARLPEGLEVDLHDGWAWLSTVHFGMTDVRLRGGIGIPGHTKLRELNVRTYVRGPDGTPGIWFFTIDAESRPIVEVVRRTFHLPYLKASFEGELPDAKVERTDRRGVAMVYEAKSGPSGTPKETAAASLDGFLHERYVLFSRSPKGHLLRGDVGHRPYELQPVTVRIARNDAVAGWPVDPLLPDRVSYCKGFPVVAWPVQGFGKLGSALADARPAPGEAASPSPEGPSS